MKTLQSGEMRVHRIGEIDRCLLDATTLFPEAAPDLGERNKTWLDERFIEPLTHELVVAYQSFVVQTRTRNILIDAGVGNHKRRPTKPWQHNLSTGYLGNFAAAGLRPQDIDLIVFTHLHADTLGWSTKLQNGQLVPTFTSAKYLFPVEDFDRLNRLHQSHPAEPVLGGAFVDSVLPIIDAGVALLVESDHVIEQKGDDGVWLESMPGHTPGNVMVHVKADTFHVVLAGDMLHHPVQLMEPHLVMAEDGDLEEAVASRRRLLRTYADTNTIVLSGHFPTPTAGRVVTWGDQYRYRWIDR